MTPFKIKVSIDHYEQMGYALKTGDTIYSKNRDGNYAVHGELINFDTKTNSWLAKGGNLKTFPLTKVGHFIEMMVVPFEQYLNKMRQKSY